MKYKDFEELPVWQEARQLTKNVYELSSKVLSRDFGLKDQLQRAAVSTMNNIAEGFDSSGNVEFIRFLTYSQRSCSEVMSMTYVLSDVYGCIEESKLLHKSALSLRKQIKGFIKYLKSKN